MTYAYVVQVQTNNEQECPSGLVDDLFTENVFYTDSLEKAKEYALQCASYNNQAYEPIYTVCRLEPVFVAGGN